MLVVVKLHADRFDRDDGRAKDVDSGSGIKKRCAGAARSMTANGNPLRTLAQHRDLRRLFVASVVSDIGTWMQAVTVGSLVAVSSRSAGATALVMSALFLPQGLCSPFGGVLADRFDRRHMAMTMLTAQALLAAGLAVLIANGVRSAMTLSAVILLQGCANALAGPALQSLIPQMVPPSELMAALSLATISWNSGRIVGPTLAALCTAAFGPSTTIVANAFSFLVPLVALAAVRRSFVSGTSVSLRRVFSELREGGSLAWRTPSIRVMFPAFVVIQLMLSSLLPAIPFYARNVLGGTNALVTALFTAVGCGAMVTAGIAPSLAMRFGRSIVSRLALGALSVGVVLAGVARSPIIAVGAVALYGAGISGFFVTAGSVVQRDAPESHRGRLVSLYVAILGLSYGLGAPLNGIIADRAWGLRSHLVGWSIVLAVAALAVQLRRPHWYRLLDDASVRSHSSVAPARTIRKVLASGSGP